MAIIKLGPVVADVRGSVGGTVFSRNAAGAYMKQRTVPTYPATSRQQNVAALLSTIIDDWKNSLTTAQRAAWNSLAAITTLPNKMGEQFTPSGLNLFVKSNMVLDPSGLAHVVAAPVAAVAPTPQLTFTHTPTTGIEITAIGNWDASPTGIVMFQHLLNGPQSQIYYKGPYVSTYPKSFSWVSTVPALLVATADLTATSRAHFRFRAVIDDGSVSAAAYASVNVGATP